MYVEKDKYKLKMSFISCSKLQSTSYHKDMRSLFFLWIKPLANTDGHLSYQVKSGWTVCDQ